MCWNEKKREIFGNWEVNLDEIIIAIFHETLQN